MASRRHPGAGGSLRAARPAVCALADQVERSGSNCRSCGRAGEAGGSSRI